MASFLPLFRGNGSVMGIRGSLCGGCKVGLLWQILVPFFEKVHRRRVNIKEKLEAETNIH